MAKKAPFSRKLISLPMNNTRFMATLNRTPFWLRMLILFFTSFIILTLIYFQKLPDDKLHLIFCNVGQGDGILIKTPAGAQILVDGGPDNSVLSCLGKNMPFYDRTLELVVLTHPQADHLTGLVSVFENYKVEKVLKTQIANNTPEFEAFLTALKNENSKEIEAVAGSKIIFPVNLTAKILWPAQETFLTPITGLNDTSIVLELNFVKFCALLTGDATNNVWFKLLSTGAFNNCFLVKIAHHGSKNATSPQFLDAVSPAMAVISAGSNNRYGHPHKEVLKDLEERRIQILRTDEAGTIEVVTDGRSVKVER